MACRRLRRGVRNALDHGRPIGLHQLSGCGDLPGGLCLHLSPLWQEKTDPDVRCSHGSGVADSDAAREALLLPLPRAAERRRPDGFIGHDLEVHRPLRRRRTHGRADENDSGVHPYLADEDIVTPGQEGLGGFRTARRHPLRDCRSNRVRHDRNPPTGTCPTRSSAWRSRRETYIGACSRADSSQS